MSGNSTFKKRLAESFSKKARTYDEKAKLQIEVASLLREKISSAMSVECRILDVGCGTGLLSLPLIETGSTIHAMDMAPGMISMIRQKSAGTGSVFPTLGDGEFLPYARNVFDLVISSLTYHWIWNLQEAFTETFRVLKNGGNLTLALNGKESLKELRTAYMESQDAMDVTLPPLVAFPAVDEVEAAISRAGFENIGVETMTINRSYSSFWELLRTLKEIGAGNPHPGKTKTLRTRSSLTAIQKIYNERYSKNGRIYASYEILFCRGRKP